MTCLNDLMWNHLVLLPLHRFTVLDLEATRMMLLSRSNIQVFKN
nr:hypothetical protein Iba_chr09aCG4220 [Ipomoea batatas]GMD33558.1 hypothetical protein Iba_chr09cCG3740 [Ipomoea batatas]GMD36978.1 hypothetical protein Iba_chr09eCG5010 [Ipomoea batatas]GMD38529.1 hypothetical protein Iba_chr09fCG4840 [Ipomoea batatas]